MSLLLICNRLADHRIAVLHDNNAEAVNSLVQQVILELQTSNAIAVSSDLKFSFAKTRKQGKVALIRCSEDRRSDLGRDCSEEASVDPNEIIFVEISRLAHSGEHVKSSRALISNLLFQ